ncbi:GtrA family protein [Thiocapsa marina 5811]|uniref:GtrA family protein n=1 Tax=Thiocapsa marina 5811 TaxID=768671 RepID=F9U6Y5_9GAMM|nr:GtrA family protein [Thiocapsa marina 5811]
MVGVFNTVAGYFIIFSSMYFLRLTAEWANVIGYVVTVGGSYLLHRRYTFRSQNPKRREFVVFILIFLFAYAINLVSLSVLVHETDTNPYVAQVLAGAVYVSVSYSLNKLMVFRPRGNG